MVAWWFAIAAGVDAPVGHSAAALLGGASRRFATDVSESTLRFGTLHFNTKNDMSRKRLEALRKPSRTSKER